MVSTAQLFYFFFFIGLTEKGPKRENIQRVAVLFVNRQTASREGNALNSLK